jgi:uncharacterized protein (DUF1499 family)
MTRLGISQLKSGLAALGLLLVCWFSLIAPADALPSLSFSATSTTFTCPAFTGKFTGKSTGEFMGEIAMGSKPLFSFSGKRPAELGVKSGQLTACPNTPNCVNSQAGDAEHKIAPIAYQSAPAAALTQLKAVIAEMERTAVVSETSDYLYVEFTSALMGYVDDVEFYFDPSTPGQLQVRSASRLGKSDLGVNRKRIEEIRAKLTAVGA